jgi:hypothetical protein
VAACRERGWLDPAGRFAPERPVLRPELDQVLARWDWTPVGQRTRPRLADPVYPGDAVTRRLALNQFVQALGDRGGPAVPLALLD